TKSTKEAKDGKAVSQIKDDKTIPQLNDDKAMPEWLTPILSALGGMGGSYMLFIKPLQERVDNLANQVSDLRGEVKELKHQNKELEKSLGEIEKKQSNAITNTISNVPVPNDYLPVKQPIGQVTYVKRRL
ncbi:MAG TPA: hypothetical protein VF411_11610, partial [Bacteroidia bacterium]